MINPRPVDKIQWRKWSALEWRNPQLDLYALGILQAKLEATGIFPTTDSLRQRQMREHLERKQAALFAFFVSHSVLRSPVQYALYEDEDFDCLIQWIADGKKYCAQVQLKEVVPPNVNPTATLDAELLKLGKYITSSHSIIAIHLNQTGWVNYSAIKKPEAAVGEIWLYSSITADQSRWFLYGDLLHFARGYEISWPTSRKPIYALT